MKYEELKGKSKDELQAVILDGKKELFNLRFQRTTGELEKTHRSKEIRKDIARAYTYLNSGAEVAAGSAKPAKAKKAAEKKEKAAKAKAEKSTKAKAAKEAKVTKKKKTA